MVHSESRDLAIAGEVEHVVVGLAPSHGAQPYPAAHLHGKRVGGIVHGTALDLQGVGKVGHACNRAVECLLQKVGVYLVFVGELHHVNRNVYRKINIRRG